MTLLMPRAGFSYMTGNVLTTRPPAVGLAFGTSVSPAQNAYGSYTEILSDASVTRNCYFMELNFNNVGTSAVAKDMIVTIGIDTAGGTSYVDFIQHLLASCAHPYGTQPYGHTYYFPVFIPAGTAIAAKASVNNASLGTVNVIIKLWGAPDDPENLIYGQGVETIGAVTASSRGTTVTSGTTSDGSWTSLGSTTRNCFAWQYGMGCNDTTMSALNYHADLSYGDGTNQIIIGQDKIYSATSGELLGSIGNPPLLCHVPSGGGIYGRLQCSGTADSGLSMAAYGVF